MGFYIFMVASEVHIEAKTQEEAEKIFENMSDEEIWEDMEVTNIEIDDEEED